jgi:putative intracellular protease/amidase
VTSVDRYPGAPRPTGLWLGEFVHAWEAFVRAGLEVVVASPAGGPTPLDPESLKPLVTDRAIRAFHGDPARMALLASTRRAAQVDPAGLAAVFYTGGHGTMWDFPRDPSLQAIAQSVETRGGVVAAVCHGVAGLLGVLDSRGRPLISGRRVTGYSDLEERLGGTRRLLDYSLQRELAARGAHYERGLVPFLPHAIADGRLVTGQNPFSTRATARATLRAMGVGGHAAPPGVEPSRPPPGPSGARP